MFLAIVQKRSPASHTDNAEGFIQAAESAACPYTVLPADERLSLPISAEPV
jgi:hypothetical protein